MNLIYIRFLFLIGNNLSGAVQALQLVPLQVFGVLDESLFLYCTVSDIYFKL